jgi:hypothetical protein
VKLRSRFEITARQPHGIGGIEPDYVVDAD